MAAVSSDDLIARLRTAERYHAEKAGYGGASQEIHIRMQTSVADAITALGEAREREVRLTVAVNRAEREADRQAKCWSDSRGCDDSLDEYHRLLKSRTCTPEEQAGPDAAVCPATGRKVHHQHTGECMAGACPGEPRWVDGIRRRQMARRSYVTLVLGDLMAAVLTALLAVGWMWAMAFEFSRAR